MTKTKNPIQGHGLEGFYNALRRPGIVRSSDGRWFSGVATGLARWLGVDPLVIRAGFILFGLFFGMGITLYLVLWLLMPDDRGRIHIEQALKHGEGSSIFLLIVTSMAVLGGGPWWDGDMHGFRIGGFFIVGALAWWFLTSTDSGRDLMRSRPWLTPGTASPSVTDGHASDPATVSTGNAAANAGASLSERVAPGAPSDPAPWAAHRPRVRGVGFAVGLLSLGLALVAGAAATTVADAADWPGSPLAIGVAAGLGLLGLATVIAGLAGRRGGWLTPFLIVAAAATLFASVLPTGLQHPWRAGEQRHVVTDLTGKPAFELGFGSLTVDLSKADPASTPATPDVVNVTLGAGELDVIVPRGVSVEVNATGRFGEVDAFGSNDPEGSRLRDGVDFARLATYGTGPVQLRVEAEVGAGQITIHEAVAK